MGIPGLPPMMSMSDDDQKQVYGNPPRRKPQSKGSTSDRYAARIDLLLWCLIPGFVVLHHAWTMWFP